jgi:hypothetical protein
MPEEKGAKKLVRISQQNQIGRTKAGEKIV